MTSARSDLIELLDNLKGSGKFASIGSVDFILPGLWIEGAGELSFPMDEVGVQRLFSIAQQAPYGKGHETLVDTDVRNTKEIDADRITFRNPAWQKTLDSILSKVRKDLGLEEKDIEAHLYKLLIYEPGSFFLKHRDTEKQKGMFGSLMVHLPGHYTGGELIVEFDQESVVADFAEGNPYMINYCGFYADCEHEVKPVIDGFRVCLAYNLTQAEELTDHAIPMSGITGKAGMLISKVFKENQSVPVMVLLGHQYTPENFEPSKLKLNDRARADVLLKAASQIGYYASLCLITSYKIGIPEYDGYYEDSDVIDEVHDEYLNIEKIVSKDCPGLKSFEFEEKDLIASFMIEDDEPLIRENTGYMGNYGPDVEYWYHYAAVMIWPKEYNAIALMSESLESQMNWISHFSITGQMTDDERRTIKLIISNGVNEGWSGLKDGLLNPIIDWVIQFDETSLLFEIQRPKLLYYFVKIHAEKWLQLCHVVSTDKIALLLELMSREMAIQPFEKLLTFLSLLIQDKGLAKLSEVQIEKIPQYILELYKNNPERLHKCALEALFKIEDSYPLSDEQIIHWTEALMLNPDRTNIIKIMVPVITSTDSELARQLLHRIKSYLQNLVENKPEPPRNWSRSVPNTISFRDVWSELQAFLESPTQDVLDIRKAQRYRDHIENAIRNATVDLTTETIRRGSPHTLRLYKNQNEYDRKLHNWETDKKNLQKVKIALNER